MPMQDDLAGALALNLGVIPGRRKAESPRVIDPAEMIDEPMMGLARAFTAFKDPWIRSLVKGTVEARMSRALGYRVEIPDEEDTKLKALLTEKTMGDLTVQVAERRTAIARAMFIDMDDKAKLALGLGGLTDPLVEDPDRALAVAQKMGLPLTRGDLSMAKQSVLTTQQAQEQKEADELESAAKKGRDQKSLVETSAFLGAEVEEAAGGGGKLGPEFERIISGVEQARGADLSSSWLGMDTDLDEPAGAAGFIDIIRATREGGIGKTVGRDKAAAILIGRFGRDIKDQLEGLETDESGRLRVSEDAGVDRQAAFYLQTAVRMLADDLGMAPADLMKQYLGLEYSGLDDQSYVAELLKMTGGDEKRAIEFLKQSGIRIEAAK